MKEGNKGRWKERDSKYRSKEGRKEIKIKIKP
jgi:hypothetical protein